MRTYLLIILVIAAALLSLRMASADTPCKDPTYQNALQSDLKTARYASDSAEKIFQNGTTASARRTLMQTIVTIIKLRQKYEDMTGLPAACADSRSQAATLFANMTDSLTFDLGQLDDSQRSDAYAQLASAQTSRIDRIATFVSGTLGGTAVSTEPLAELLQTNSANATATGELAWLNVTATYAARTSTRARQAQDRTATSAALATSSGSSTPGDAAALCVDGAYWYSTERRGACSNHGGVATWYK